MRVFVSVQSHNQSVKVMQFLRESHKSRAQKKRQWISNEIDSINLSFCSNALNCVKRFELRASTAKQSLLYSPMEHFTFDAYVPLSLSLLRD